MNWRDLCRSRRIAWKDSRHHPFLQDYWAQCCAVDQLSAGELQQLKRQNLNTLIANVAANVPFYQDWAQRTGYEPGDNVRLTDLPVVSKSNYTENIEAFQSTAVPPSQMLTSRTSGSSGEPFQLRVHPASSDYSYACMWRNLARHGIRPGMRRGYIWGGSWQFSLGRLAATKKRIMLAGRDWLNSTLSIDAYRLHDGRVLDAVARLRRFQPEYLHGYVSALYVIARHINDTGLHGMFPSLKAVITESEKLFEFQKEAIEQAFSVPVVEVYGSVEMGSIAMNACDGTMRINEDMFLVERDDAGRAVMTNCKATAFPFIRYLQGDLIEINESPGGELPYRTLTKIVGRTVDLVSRADGGLVHGVALAHVIDPHLDIVRQYQLHQKRGELVIKLVTREPLPRQRQDKIRADLIELLGQVPIRFEFPSEVLPDSSGKLRWVKSDITSKEPMNSQSE